MKKIGLNCLLPLGICVSGVSWAGPETCNALLSVGIYNINNTSESVDSRSMALSSFCQADYSLASTSTSQQGAISASYGIASGNLNVAASRDEIIQTQKQLCTSGFNSSEYSRRASESSRIIFQGALDAWNKCQALNNNGKVEFDLIPNSKMHSAAVTISANSGGTYQFMGLSQVGVGRSTCQTTLPARTGSLSGQVINVDASTSFPFSASSKLTIICSRNMVNDGKGNYSADAQALIFNTSAGPYQVDLAELGGLSRLTVDNVINQASASARPPGTVIAFAGSTCPVGSLLANGAAVDKLTYPKLSAAIGINHGGTTSGSTFNLPDYRGRFLRGVDGGAGNDPDRDSRTAMNNGGNTKDAVGSVQADAFRSHTHGISSGNANTFYVQGGNSYPYTDKAFKTTAGSEDPPGGAETRPKNANVNYCIYY